ncbi:esterase [Fulvivirga maritima]|uniref:esterase n=1 Tax=Fulvivirga maritima TaxID=2904247 RepID=UPI001F39662D|nr:esterase [Fulvivirga maritima]UII25981.1 esterase [Fulvivirga maritima]
MRLETLPFTSRDGMCCNLLHAISDQVPDKGPLLLVHGAGVRANIFNSPTTTNIIQYALAQGYDVWLENWRASIDLPASEWDLDQAAINDHPAAVQKIVELTGSKTIKAIIHCQGSTSFMISAVLGLIPEVTVIVSNAVSLHPVVPKYSVFKMNVYVPAVSPFFTYLNPQWGKHAPDAKTKLLKLIVKTFHRENDTMVGKFVSFVYGAGWPALWELENLNDATKNWIKEEFAAVPLSFFHHMRRCMRAGHLVSNNDETTSYAPSKLNTDARIILFAGAKNKCFCSDSQLNTYNYLNKVNPGKHSLYVLDEYSHLDVFFGKNAHKDVFPLMFKELNAQ